MAATYVTLQEFKAAEDITETARDGFLGQLLASASRAIDRWCCVDPGHFGGLTAETRYLDVTAADASNGRLDIPPLLALTTMKTDWDGDGTFETAWTVGTDYLLYPLNETPKTQIQTTQATGRYALPMGQRRVQLVGDWGEAASVPDDITMAVILQANRWRSRVKSPDGMAGNSDVGFIALADLDPDVAAILERGRYRRPEVFA